VLSASIEIERLSKIACADTCSRKSSQGNPTRLTISHINRRGERICSLGIAPESHVRLSGTKGGTRGDWQLSGSVHLFEDGEGGLCVARIEMVGARRKHGQRRVGW
jgi:hypothetical protein